MTLTYLLKNIFTYAKYIVDSLMILLIKGDTRILVFLQIGALRRSQRVCKLGILWYYGFMQMHEGTDREFIVLSLLTSILLGSYVCLRCAAMLVGF